MRSFLDASVIAAIVGGEKDEADWAEIVGMAPVPVTSALALWEAARAVSRLRAIESASALKEIDAFLDLRGVEIVAVTREEAIEALDAHDRYGKGNHLAKLNMGDCFAYACAKTNGARLLYKGEDFGKTDLA